MMPTSHRLARKAAKGGTGRHGPAWLANGPNGSTGFLGHPRACLRSDICGPRPVCRDTLQAVALASPPAMPSYGPIGYVNRISPNDINRLAVARGKLAGARGKPKGLRPGMGPLGHRFGAPRFQKVGLKPLASAQLKRAVCFPESTVGAHRHLGAHIGQMIGQMGLFLGMICNDINGLLDQRSYAVEKRGP
jgi:hypothetical protein